MMRNKLITPVMLEALKRWYLTEKLMRYARACGKKVAITLL